MRLNAMEEYGYAHRVKGKAARWYLIGGGVAEFLKQELMVSAIVVNLKDFNLIIHVFERGLADGRLGDPVRGVLLRLKRERATAWPSRD